MSENFSFAAFIMTYKRPLILKETIYKIKNQSHPPGKILIIDNDPECSAKNILLDFSDTNVSYRSVGYNSGPAGAAKLGLEILSNEGYQWIAWMDDDDPPIFEDTFEILLKLAISEPNCGCVGTVGQYFNRSNGLINRVYDHELDQEGSLFVDNIAGGMCKIVNAAVCIKGKVYPDEQLFYGFEELDFDLRMQKAGFSLLVDKQLYKRHRIHYNRIDLNTKRGSIKPLSKLWREYYSTRNSLIILYRNKLRFAFLKAIFRNFIKIFIGYRFGLKYGSYNAKIISKGLFDFATGKYGAVNFK